ARQPGRKRNSYLRKTKTRQQRGTHGDNRAKDPPPRGRPRGTARKVKTQERRAVEASRSRLLCTHRSLRTPGIKPGVIRISPSKSTVIASMFQVAQI
ncbi:MAG: hypothetical protein ABUL47_04840, partial [Leifsonia sp.]